MIPRLEGSYARPLIVPGLEQASVRAPLTTPDVYEWQPPFFGYQSLAENWSGSTESILRRPLGFKEQLNVREVTEAEPATLPSGAVQTTHDRVKARFRMLRTLPANHDCEGAAAPNFKSIDNAIAFIDRIASAPMFTATLDDDGSAVIEFENRATGFFADITFRAAGNVELYKREAGHESEFFEGNLDSVEARRFLEPKIGLAV